MFWGMEIASCDGVMAMGREGPESRLCSGQEASDKGPVLALCRSLAFMCELLKNGKRGDMMELVF